MEHLVGQTLAELLEGGRRLPLALTIEIFQQTCSAVQEAHRLGIIHRDLKPENIWLEHRAPDGYHVKVLDFGVAKLRAVDARSDVYSLGVLAYRMLGGEAPFTGRTGSLYMEHVRTPPPPLGDRAPGLPAAVASVVMRALEKDAARRPPTAQAFSTALTAAAEGSGELVRRAITLTVAHFSALVRISLIGHGPILALAALRLVNRRLVLAGVVSEGAGRIIGATAIVAHALCVLFVLPMIMGLVTLLVRDLEAAPRGPHPAPPPAGEVLRCLRRSIVPSLLMTGLLLVIADALRRPLEWLAGHAVRRLPSIADMPGLDVIVPMVLETLTLFAFVRVARGFAVYPSVVAMEHRGGLAALRRSSELTRPCRTIAARVVLFHFLPRALIVPWFMPAFAQFSRLPYREVINTSSDTLSGAGALAGLYLINILVAPFGMTALSLLYLKTRKLEGASLDAASTDVVVP